MKFSRHALTAAIIEKCDFQARTFEILTFNSRQKLLKLRNFQDRDTLSLLKLLKIAIFKPAQLKWK